MREKWRAGGLMVAVLLLVVGLAAIVTLAQTDAPAGTPDPGPYRIAQFAATPGTAGSPLAPIPTVPAATVTAIAGRVAAASSGIALPFIAMGLSATSTPTPTAPPVPTATAVPAPILDGASVYTQISPAVVMISNPTQRQPQSHAAGIASGTIFDAQGDIVTIGDEVVGSSDGTLVQQVDVIFPSGKQVSGKVVGRDAFTDLAVIKIDPTAVPGSITFGDASTAAVGDPVLAIGAPLQFTATVTRGNISGLNRAVDEQSGLIQTSVSASTGLYGGPLVDARGNVIGIITYNLHDDSATYKVAFAMPSNAVKPVVTALAQGGKIARPDLGATFETLTPTRAVALGLGVDTGAYITAVTKGGPADSAGLMAGDVITAVNGTTLTNTTTLHDILGALMPKQNITLTVNRSGSAKQLMLTLASGGQ